ncbi:MAG: hypothetical protein KIT81_17255 [Alphaproteobacteria bacterium]|nr:hypothetical protein [Alphaproteobacteria bacterium]
MRAEAETSGRGERAVGRWRRPALGAPACALVLALCWLAWPAAAPAVTDAAGRPAEQARTAAPLQLLRAEAGGTYRPLEPVATELHITANGPIARSRLRQTYAALPAGTGDLLLRLAAPPHLEVDSITVRSGEQLLKTRVALRRLPPPAGDAARVQSFSLPALAPGQKVSIEIGYGEELHFLDGAFVLEAPAWAAHYDHLAASIDAGLPIAEVTSRSHEVKVIADGTSAIYVVPQRPRPGAATGLHLAWRADTGRSARFGVFTETKDGFDHVLLTVMPPSEPRGTAEDALRHARQLLFILDARAGMDRETLRQIGAQVLAALGRLGTSDSFNLVAAGRGTRQLFEYASAVNGDTLSAARTFLAGLAPDGETAPLRVLARLARELAPSSFRQIVVVGDLGEDEEALAELRAAQGGNRLFFAAIGAASPLPALARTARLTRGQLDLAAEAQDLPRTLEQMLRRIERPILVDILARWPEDLAADAFPHPVPDLYADAPVAVAARLQGSAGPGAMVEITGSMPGRFWRGLVGLDQGRAARGIAKRWAHERLDALTLAEAEGFSAEVREQVSSDTALRYGLISDYTSLVSETPSR